MEEIWSIWWVWLSGALVLGILEVLLPGFVFLGFAIGAVVMAVILLLPGPTFGLPVLVLIFAALSLVSWLVMRKMFALPKGQVKRFDRDIND
jgi:inner membrane protein